MKKIFLISFIIFVLQSSTQGIFNKELPLLIQAGQQQGWDLDEWQTIVMSDVTKADFDHITNKIQNRYLITTFNTENAVKYVFEPLDHGEFVSHYFQAVQSTSVQDKISLQVILTGNKWNEKIKTHYKDLTNRLQSDYNIPFTKTFTCLKFDLGGIIKNGSSFDEFWQNLKVVHKEEQYDNVLYSKYEKEIYGYSPLWGNEINVNNEKINFQMTVTNDAEYEKQVIIGTPMILNEY